MGRKQTLAPVPGAHVAAMSAIGQEPGRSPHLRLTVRRRSRGASRVRATRTVVDSAALRTERTRSCSVSAAM
jgi:hypothetical protein